MEDEGVEVCAQALRDLDPGCSILTAGPGPWAGLISRLSVEDAGVPDAASFLPGALALVDDRHAAAWIAHLGWSVVARQGGMTALVNA